MKYGLAFLMLMALPCRSQTGNTPPPRRLPDSLKTELSACLKKKPGRFSIMSIASDSEAYNYAEDWREVLTSAGWKMENPNMLIGTFQIVAGRWSGMRVGVHDASDREGQTALADGSPEQNFSQCAAGKRDIPAGGRLISYKDKPTGSISIQISDQPQQTGN